MAGNSKGQGFKDGKPNIGKTGSSNNQPGGSTGSIKSGGTSSAGQQIDFLPSANTYSGRKGGGPVSSGNSAGGKPGKGIPFLPVKPE